MNRFGSNSFENEYDHFAENQRFGRQLAENNPRPWNESHNRRRGYQGSQYSEPWYRVPTPDRHTYENRSRSGQHPDFYAGAHHDYPENDPAWRHHDDQIWRERNDYKDSDYRYRSGHRNYWHEDYDDKYEPARHPHNRHPDSFIERMGQGIREGWNNLIHPERERERDRYDQYRQEHHRSRQPRHWPNSERYDDYEQRRQQDARAEERYQDEMRRRQHEQRTRNQSPGWHNSGPDHRDEDFFDSRNFRI